MEDGVRSTAGLDDVVAAAVPFPSGDDTELKRRERLVLCQVCPGGKGGAHRNIESQVHGLPQKAVEGPEVSLFIHRPPPREISLPRVEFSISFGERPPSQRRNPLLVLAKMPLKPYSHLIELPLLHRVHVEALFLVERSCGRYQVAQGLHCTQWTACKGVAEANTALSVGRTPSHHRTRAQRVEAHKRDDPVGRGSGITRAQRTQTPLLHVMR